MAAKRSDMKMEKIIEEENLSDELKNKITVARKIATCVSEKCRTVDLSNLDIKMLPPQIKNSSLLTRISLASNKIINFPTSICLLTSLNEIDLGNNTLLDVCPQIQNLTGLRKLNLRGNRLRTLPPEIGTLHQLFRLDVSNNKLRQLPCEIATLTSLAILNASQNRLSSLTPQVGKLQRLTSLDISGNRLSVLPKEMLLLKQIQKISVGENSFDLGIFGSGKQSKDEPLERSGEDALSLLKFLVNTGGASRPDAKKCVWINVGKQGVKRIGAGTEFCLRIQCYDKNNNELTQGGERIRAKCQDKHGAGVDTETTVSDLNNGQYDVKFTPHKAGVLRIHVGIAVSDPSKGEQMEDVASPKPHPRRTYSAIASSPFTFLVVPAKPSAAKCHANGSGLKEAVCGKISKIFVQNCDSWGNPLSESGGQIMAWVEKEGDEARRLPTVSVKDLLDGRHCISYCVYDVGSYRIKIKLENTHISKSPFRVKAVPGPPCAKQCVLKDTSCKIVSDIRLLAEHAERYSLHLHDECGNMANEAMESVKDCITSSLIGDIHAVHTLYEYGGSHPILSFSHNEDVSIPKGAAMEISLNGEQIKGSPFPVVTRRSILHDDSLITGRSDPKRCVISGDGATQCIVQEVTSFTILSYDSRGNACASASIDVKIKSAAINIECTISNQGNGEHLVQYSLPIPGVYILEILCDGTPVNGSPSLLNCNAPPYLSATPAIPENNDSSLVKCKCVIKKPGKNESSQEGCRVVMIPSSISYRDFVRRIQEAFGGSQLYVQYQDEDGDVVDLSGPSDLAEAMSWVCESSGTAKLKLYVTQEGNASNSVPRVSKQNFNHELNNNDGKLAASLDQDTNDEYDYVKVSNARYELPESPGLTKTIYIKQPQRRRLRPALPNGFSSPKYGNVTQNIRLKCTLENDTRILSVSSQSTVDEILSRIQNEFGIPVIVKYRDNDGDKITITNQASLNEAFSLATHYHNVGISPASPYSPFTQGPVVRMYLTASEHGGSTHCLPSEQLPLTQNYVNPQHKSHPFSQGAFALIDRELTEGENSLRRKASNNTAKTHRRDNLLGMKYKMTEDLSKMQRSGVTLIVPATDVTTGDAVHVLLHRDTKMHERSVDCLSSLKCDFTAQLLYHEKDVAGGMHVLVLEKSDITLPEYVNGGNSLSGFECKYISHCLASALSHIHACGFVLVNLTPQSIGRVAGKWKIIEFSSARRVTNHIETQLSSYSSPEEVAALCNRKQQLKAEYSLDCWHLGCIIFELFARRPLFSDFDSVLRELEYSDKTFNLHLDAVSDVQAKHLLRKVLVTNAARRSTAETMLKHALLSGGLDTVQRAKGEKGIAAVKGGQVKMNKMLNEMSERVKDTGKVVHAQKVENVRAKISSSQTLDEIECLRDMVHDMALSTAKK